MFKRAIALAPSYATAYQWFGNSLTQTGDLDEAITMGRKSVLLDPKSAILRSSLADNLFTSGRDDESWSVCASVLAEQPDWHDCHDVQFDIALARKNFSVARSILQQMATPRGSEALRLAQDMSDVLEGKGDANAVAERLVSLPDGFLDATSLTPLSSFEVVHWLLVIGREDLAVERYARLARENTRAAPILAFDTHLAILHCNPKFLEVLRSLKVAEPHLAAACPKAQ
jgi:tetratricopeptide (TPR) repeat protein